MPQAIIITFWNIVIKPDPAYRQFQQPRIVAVQITIDNIDNDIIDQNTHMKTHGRVGKIHHPTADARLVNPVQKPHNLAFHSHRGPRLFRRHNHPGRDLAAGAGVFHRSAPVSCFAPSLPTTNGKSRASRLAHSFCPFSSRIKSCLISIST